MCLESQGNFKPKFKLKLFSTESTPKVRLARVRQGVQGEGRPRLPRQEPHRGEAVHVVSKSINQKVVYSNVRRWRLRQMRFEVKMFNRVLSHDLLRLLDIFIS